MTPLAPVTLRGAAVVLQPLTAGHAPALWRVAQDPELWRWTLSQVCSPADLDAYIEAALGAQAAGTALPFALRVGGQVAGSTRLANADVPNGRIEIGWTFIGQPWQRTVVNTEAKLLLMRHAFETLGARRVEFKTDALNVRSRAAIARLGATEEGTLRQHMVTASGRVRDTVYFSVLASEWPAVQTRLTERLDRLPAAPDATSTA
ncbi:MAG TPA: GNAT family N-acetyltransferase [Rubricoccaceae bacterium]